MAISRPSPSLLFALKKFDADCTASESTGDCVYISDDKVADRLQVRTADPTERTKMPAIGLIISKPTATTCVVQTIGEVDGLYSGLTVGHVMVIDADGRLTNSPPAPAIGSLYYIQAMGTVVDDTSVILSPNFMITGRRG